MTTPKRAKCSICDEFCYPKLCVNCRAYLCKKCVLYFNNKPFCKGCYIDLFEGFENEI